MDKIDLSKLKMASSSLGERIKTSGAQMGRTISSKMKEMLQSPTPESKIVDEATSDSMLEPNWGLNLRICAMINSEEFNGAEIVKAIKRKLVSSKSPISQRLTLDLLETCTSNTEKMFAEVASQKVLDDMVQMIDDPKTDHGNRVRAMQLIRAWGESEELMYLPVFHQTHLYLKTRETSPMSQDGSLPHPQHTLESYMDQPLMSPPQGYPHPDAGFENADNSTSVGYGGQSVEEKKEFLVITRNSLDVLSSILASEVDPKPLKEELTVSMLEKCKQSLPVIQRIVESTSDDEAMLFEALNLHDELRHIISRYEELEAAQESGKQRKSMDAGELPHNSHTTEASAPVVEASRVETEGTNPSKAETPEPKSQNPEVSSQVESTVDKNKE